MSKLNKNDDGSYSITPRQAGPEAAAVGAGFPPDLAGENLGALEGGLELASGGVLSYALYATILSVIETIPDVRDGRITRAQQVQIVADRVWESCSSAVPTVVIVSVVLTLAPWLSGPAFLAGIFGAGVMGTRIIRSIIDALPEEQKKVLRDKAANADVTIPGLSTT